MGDVCLHRALAYLIEVPLPRRLASLKLRPQTSRSQKPRMTSKKRSLLDLAISIRWIFKWGVITSVRGMKYLFVEGSNKPASLMRNLKTWCCSLMTAFAFILTRSVCGCRWLWIAVFSLYVFFFIFCLKTHPWHSWLLILLIWSITVKTICCCWFNLKNKFVNST